MVFAARIEIDVEDKDGKVARKAITVKPGADLFALSATGKFMKITQFPALTVLPVWNKSNCLIPRLFRFTVQ